MRRAVDTAQSKGNLGQKLGLVKVIFAQIWFPESRPSDGGFFSFRGSRFSENFRDRLLGFRHGGGFSVYGRHLILNEESARLAHMARYAVRPPVAMDRVHEGDDGQVLLDIPPDHRTGATVLSLDPLEWLRRVTNQIPEKGTQLVLSFGAYAHRLRKLYRDPSGEVTEDRAEKEPPLPNSRARLCGNLPGSCHVRGSCSRWTR
jgi:hypothetical protein